MTCRSAPLARHGVLVWLYFLCRARGADLQLAVVLRIPGDLSRNIFIIVGWRAWLNKGYRGTPELLGLSADLIIFSYRIYFFNIMKYILSNLNYRGGCKNAGKNWSIS